MKAVFLDWLKFDLTFEPNNLQVPLVRKKMDQAHQQINRKHHFYQKIKIQTIQFPSKALINTLIQSTSYLLYFELAKLLFSEETYLLQMLEFQNSVQIEVTEEQIPFLSNLTSTTWKNVKELTINTGFAQKP